MAVTVREAYGEIWGRVPEATFFRLGLQTLSERVLGSIFLQVLGDSGCPLGLPGAPVGTQNGDLFQGLVFSHFLDHFWEGPAAGAGLPGPSESEESAE